MFNDNDLSNAIFKLIMLIKEALKEDNIDIKNSIWEIDNKNIIGPTNSIDLTILKDRVTIHKVNNNHLANYLSCSYIGKDI
jgi:hypothetical protein